MCFLVEGERPFFHYWKTDTGHKNSLFPGPSDTPNSCFFRQLSHLSAFAKILRHFEQFVATLQTSHQMPWHSSFSVEWCHLLASSLEKPKRLGLVIDWNINKISFSFPSQRLPESVGTELVDKCLSVPLEGGSENLTWLFSKRFEQYTTGFANVFEKLEISQ